MKMMIGMFVTLLAAFPMIAAGDMIQMDDTNQSNQAQVVIRDGSIMLDELVQPVMMPKDHAGLQDIEQVSFSEGFEGDFPGMWSVTGSPNAWGVEDDVVYDGDAALWCSGDGRSPHQGYQSHTLTTIVYGPFDFSECVDGTLDFWHWTETEPDFDFLFAGVSTDGQLFEGLFISGMISEWTYQQMNIADQCGGDLYLMFRFFSDQNHNYDGVWLDNITLTGFQPENDDDEFIADIVVTNLIHYPVNPFPGDSLSVQIYLKNEGNAPTGPFQVDIIKDSPYKPELGTEGELGSLISLGLLPGQEITRIYRTVYETAGTKHLWAIVDSDAQVLESNEQDNIAGIYDVPVGVTTQVEAEPYFDVVVPAEGGTFAYNVSVNQYGIEAIVEGWVSITYQSYGNAIVIGRWVDRLFYPEMPYAFEFTQNVPAGAPEGDYRLAVAVGVYPWIVTDAASFTFKKAGTVAADDTWTDPSQWPTDSELLLSGQGEEPASTVPGQFTMNPAYPNPFNPSTTIELVLPEAARLDVRVFNTEGRVVATLADSNYQAGNHTLTFDGNHLASGVYFVQARTSNGDVRTQKLMLMK